MPVPNQEYDSCFPLGQCIDIVTQCIGGSRGGVWEDGTPFFENL